MKLSDTYGPRGGPADGDFTAAFSCRQASASPCTSAASRGNGSWSEHAYGGGDGSRSRRETVRRLGNDARQSLTVVPRSQPPAARMVTPAVVRTFQSVGWDWGGNWSDSTKDYMHFSATRHLLRAIRSAGGSDPRFQSSADVNERRDVLLCGRSVGE